MLIVEEFQAKKSLGRDLKESNQFNAPISIRTAVSQSRPNIYAQLSRSRPLRKMINPLKLVLIRSPNTSTDPHNYFSLQTFR